MKKRLGAAFLAFCMAFGMLPGMALAEDPTCTEHSWNEGIITEPATCTEEGEKTFTCTICGETKAEAVPVIDHIFDQVTDNKNGTHSPTCSVCGEKKDAVDCSWGAGLVTEPITCTGKGEMTYTCTVCGGTKVNPIINDNAHHLNTAGVCTYCNTTFSAAMNQAYHAVSDLRSVASIASTNGMITKENVYAYLDEAIRYAVGSSVDFDILYRYYTPPTATADGSYEYTLTLYYDSGREVIELDRVLTVRLGETGEENYISIPASDNGEIIPSVRYAVQGERVTLTVHPDSGYELDKLTVSDIRGRTLTVRDMGSGRYSFTMPNSRVTVDASFVSEEDEEAPASTVSVPGTNHTAQQPGSSEVFTGLGTPGVSGIVLNPTPMTFTDVRPGDWYYDSVDYVWKHYLMSGVSETQFDPNTTTSRAMTWTIMARMNNIRTDVNPGATWYDRGMVWAKENGITDGSDPMGNITREQLAAMLWRQAGSPTGAAADLSQFSDVGSVSSYAQSAVRWAVANGILNGSDGKLNPQGTATRAQVAAMVARYGDKIA